MEAFPAKTVTKKDILKDRQQIAKNIKRKQDSETTEENKKELFSNEEEFLQALGVEDLNNLVTITTASRRLKIKEKTILNLCKADLFPYCQLSYKGNHQYFFNTKDLENINNLIFIKRNIGFTLKRNGDAYVQSIMAKILDLPLIKTKLTPTQIILLKETLEEGTTTHELLDKIKATSLSNLNSQLKSAMRKLMLTIQLFTDEMQWLDEKNIQLEKEVTHYKQLISKLPKKGIASNHLTTPKTITTERGTLNTPIHKTNFSIRTKNCLMSAKIFNLAELQKKSETELLKIKNFGKLSLNEVKQEFIKRGVNWN